MTRILLAVFLVTSAPQTQERFDPDEAFRQAREMGFSGDYEVSSTLCLKILEQYPNYSDVRLFLGRLQAWNKQYDLARQSLLQVLSGNPADTDTWSALIDVELWSGHPDQALQYSGEGLKFTPADPALLYKRALAFERLNQPKNAAETARRILDINPSNREARSLLNRSEVSSSLYSFRADYGYEQISSFESAWQTGSMSLSRRIPAGSVIGRFNYANRSGSPSHQYELDVYPVLGRGLYGYVNYGYSAGPIFPKHRIGFEIFTNPAKGLEVAGGFRYLHFSSDLWIYTGSIGKYFGKYFAGFRPFVRPHEGAVAASGTFLIRRYFTDPDSYIGFTVGAGSAPLNTQNAIDIEPLNSRRVATNGSFPVGPRVHWEFNAGWDNERLPFDQHRNRLSVGTGVTKRF